MKAHGWIGAPRQIPVRDEEISWVQAYERRMRRFNLEVILVALSALTMLIAWFFIVEWALFQNSGPLLPFRLSGGFFRSLTPTFGFTSLKGLY